jgi:hypothetical protein
MKRVRIFCPKCHWVPQEWDRWECEPSCGCVWNTFDTCGVCPSCGKNWENTQCLDCGCWSPHAEWYHESAPDAQERAADQLVAAPHARVVTAERACAPFLAINL